MSDNDESIDMQENQYLPINMDDEEAADDADSDSDMEMETSIEQPGSSNEEKEPDFVNYEVWNAPRPNELNIELDSSKAEEVWKQFQTLVKFL